jgi:hypothetical protein
MISRYAFCVRGVYLSNRTYNDKAQSIEELTLPIYAYLFGSNRHPIRRAKAMLELPKVLDKYAPLDGSGPQSATQTEQSGATDDTERE